MASFESVVRVNENAFRAPGKVQPKGGRKALGDLTNSSKLPAAKDKPSGKNLGNLRAQEKAILPNNKKSRKPFTDLTNSNKPLSKELSSKKTCTGDLSCEGFLHDHSECIKAQKQYGTMSLDDLLETVGLRRGSEGPALVLSTPQIPDVLAGLKSELDIVMELDELEMMSPPLTPRAQKSSPSPKYAMSPFGISDWKNLELSPLKLKESPLRN